MRLAISNIAWDVSEDEAVVDLLRQYGLDAIDIAPGKYFSHPRETSLAQIEKVRSWWSDRGFEITGMQALLFGTVGLNCFGSPAVQEAMLEHLSAICRIGSALGAKRLVFGSPKNRDRSGLSDDEALEAAAGFFRQLGQIALSHGVIICLEPNPAAYGANFMTTSSETAHVVRKIDHPAIRMQLDTGALSMNGESIESVLKDCADWIGHIHASEPHLVPLGDSGTDHGRLRAALQKYAHLELVSIEMLATQGEPHLKAIERALVYATSAYDSLRMN
ncbi:MAG: sugar phosphate isomerase/epimerase family protein [Bdellovibrionia bacterium]